MTIEDYYRNRARELEKEVGAAYFCIGYLASLLAKETGRGYWDVINDAERHAQHVLRGVA